MMKNLICVIVCLLCSTGTFAQSCVWARSAGGTSAFDYTNSVAADATGNVYAAGYFLGPNISFDSTTLTSSGGGIFLSKYAPDGTILWSRGSVGSALAKATSVAVDAMGNVYLAGFFDGSTIIFDGITLTNNSTGGDADLFLVKYTAAGSIVWARNAGGTNGDFANSITTDTAGNVIVAGYFLSPTIAFGSTTLTNSGNADIFLAKYNAEGSVLWAKKAGGGYDDVANSVATDIAGNVYVTGYFGSSPITFGSVILTTDSNYADIFLAKYDSEGDLLWAKSAGGANSDGATSVCTDTATNVYVAGYLYSSTATFGSTTVTNDAMGTTTAIFLAKYASDGTVFWAKSTGGLQSDQANSVSADASGNVYMTGTFRSDSINLGGTTLTKTGYNNDIFLAKYATDGSVYWAKSAGGTTGIGSDYATSVVADVSGDVYVAGFFYSSNIVFDSILLPNDSTGTSNIFLAKYNTVTGLPNGIIDNVFLYPNPANTSIVIKPDGVPAGEYEISFCSLIGKEVLKRKICCGETLINVEALPAGVYFVRVLNLITGDCSVTRLIKR